MSKAPAAIDGKNVQAVMRELTRPFLDDEVEWRVDRKNGNKVSLLCYIDSRSARARLNRVVGPHNWSVENFVHQVEGQTPIFRAGLSILIRGTWVSKWDGAGLRSMHGKGSELHEAKAGFSDAFKRACTCWGMGENLYELPKTQVEAFDGYPRGAPKNRVVNVGGNRYCVAPSVRELQAQSLPIEDLISYITDPEERRFARVDMVRLKMGWPHPSQVPAGQAIEILNAFEAASAVWEEDMPTNRGVQSPTQASTNQLKVASHRLAAWCEDGVLREQMLIYGAWVLGLGHDGGEGTPEAQNPGPPSQPPQNQGGQGQQGGGGWTG